MSLSTLPTVSLPDDFADDLCALESLFDDLEYHAGREGATDTLDEVKCAAAYFKFNLLPHLLALVETNSYLGKLNELRTEPVGSGELTREQYELVRSQLNELAPV